MAFLRHQVYASYGKASMRINQHQPIDKLSWAATEYRKRIEEAKACQWFGDSKNLEKIWDNRRKRAGVSKDECKKLLHEVAYK
jgi:hypothetical protein